MDKSLLRAFVVDLAKAERIIRPSVLRSILALRKYVLAFFRENGRLPDSFEYLQSLGLVDDLSLGMAYAHMMGSNAIHRYYDKQTLKFDQLAKIRGLFSETNLATIEYLKNRYNSKAFEIVQRSSEYVDIVLRDILTKAFTKGLPIKSITKELQRGLDSVGMQSLAPNVVETIARTNTQLAFNAGKSTAERDPDIAEIIWGYVYVTVGDDRVRDEHAILDQITLPRDDKFWEANYPPNGWNCRCQVIPIFEKEPIKGPPKGYEGPHKDFNFNPADAFSGITG